MTKFFNDQGGMKNLVERLEAAKAKMPAVVRHAHKHCSKHRTEINSGEKCGCFYCLEIYEPREIADWTDDGQTALCARCGIDSVIGSSSGIPVTKEFLQEMHKYWF